MTDAPWVVLIFLPLFLLVMFGYAVTLDVSHAPVAVVDLDGSRLSRRVVAAPEHQHAVL